MRYFIDETGIQIPSTDEENIGTVPASEVLLYLDRNQKQPRRKYGSTVAPLSVGDGQLSYIHSGELLEAAATLDINIDFPGYHIIKIILLLLSDSTTTQASVYAFANRIRSANYGDSLTATNLDSMIVGENLSLVANNLYGITSAEIYGYDRDDMYTSFRFFSGFEFTDTFHGVYQYVNKVESVQFVPSVGRFASGTKWLVYGVKK